MRLIIRPLKEHWGNTIFKRFMVIYHIYYDIHPHTLFVVSNYSYLNLCHYWMCDLCWLISYQGALKLILLNVLLMSTYYFTVMFLDNYYAYAIILSLYILSHFSHLYILSLLSFSCRKKALVLMLYMFIYTDVK